MGSILTIFFEKAIFKKSILKALAWMKRIIWCGLKWKPIFLFTLAALVVEKSVQGRTGLFYSTIIITDTTDSICNMRKVQEARNVCVSSQQMHSKG